ncbi:hypothetical protein OS493_040105 [Desmophyllum pertusum]|uniref:Uncharacterized protein n=1 Tax=Desmophyllum pertusum TaxID=174260 RepID=A0A9W9Z5G9_9CNID|nr:hypothetical protein OS493_040105 [Desmophyllum pertusum]
MGTRILHRKLSDRSYLIQSGDKTVRRNRQFLKPAAKTSAKDKQSSNIGSEPSTQDRQSSNAVSPGSAVNHKELPSDPVMLAKHVGPANFPTGRTASCSTRAPEDKNQECLSAYRISKTLY